MRKNLVFRQIVAFLSRITMSIAQQLMDMGFPADKAEAAAGNNRNLDQALDWIEKDGAGVPMETDAPAQAAPGAADSGAPPVAASFKCDE